MPDFAQSTISRVEKMMLSFENAMKLRPYIEKWMALDDKDALALCSVPPSSGLSDPSSSSLPPANITTSSMAHPQQPVSYQIVSPSPPLPGKVYSIHHPVSHIEQHSAPAAMAIAPGREIMVSAGYPHDARYDAGPAPYQLGAKHGSMLKYDPHHLSGAVDARSGTNGIMVMPTLRRRKRRLVLEPATRNFLEETFRSKPRPTPDELSLLAQQCDLEKEEVRVWFCNRRQKEKRLANAPVTLNKHASHPSNGHYTPSAGGHAVVDDSHVAVQNMHGTARGMAGVEHAPNNAQALSDYEMSPQNTFVDVGGNAGASSEKEGEEDEYRSTSSSTSDGSEDGDSDDRLVVDA